MVSMQKTEYNKMPLTDEPIMNFFISNNSYSKWFDKNVLPIKKAVKDIGDLNNFTIKETKNIFYMTRVI